MILIPEWKRGGQNDPLGPTSPEILYFRLRGGEVPTPLRDHETVKRMDEFAWASTNPRL